MAEKEMVFTSSSEFQDFLFGVNQKTTLFRNQNVSELVFVNKDKELYCSIPESGAYYPLRDCAKSSLYERLSISGDSLNIIGLNDLTTILNICKRIKTDKQAQICLVDGAIDAILSDNATGNDFTSLPANELVYTVQEWIWTHFGSEVDFNASWTHSYIYARWLLDYTKEIGGIDYNFALTVSTSDIGNGSIILRLTLINGSKEIPLCDNVVISHRTESKISDISEGLDMLLSMAKGDNEVFKQLKDTKIMYPDTTLKRIAKKAKLPKRTFYNAVEFPVIASNALECYLILSSITEEYAKSQESFKYRDVLTQNVWKTARMNWSAYDMAGEFNW